MALDAERELTQWTAGIDGLCGKTRKLTGRENFDFARRASSAQAIVTMTRMGRAHAGRSPARPNPCRIFLQGRLWPFKLLSTRKIEFFHTIDVKRTLGIGQPTSHLGGEGPLAERREWGIAGVQGPSGKGLAPAVLRVWRGNLLPARA